ncbi:MAG TPA: ion transporter [Chitinophagaceae bacterium]|nr:ion transporter [Chitinophagaceae bacterium]MCB9056104.1 ion transporter [Chitinophagales bacterium]HPG12061.1 ion transporter [Chitinophagaceae bacterium]HRX93604.1 ion transporter [Chitinophagaceae bacterium]
MKDKLRRKLHQAFFEHSTPTGKAFDIFLMIMILTSITIVMLDSMPSLHVKHKHTFHSFEWFFTILFTIEYLLRASLAKRPMRFVFSFLGIVDLLAIMPTYFTLFLPGTQPLLVLRALRLLRIFRIFRLSHFLVDIKFLTSALTSSFRKISIFFLFALVVVIIMATVMYLVEKPEDGFTSIPKCIYWSVTTITTVGYGDIVPKTPMGMVIANILMMIGFAIIAVPTGIITTEMAIAIKSRDTNHEICRSCKKKGHDHDAIFCKHCGAKFEAEEEELLE